MIGTLYPQVLGPLTFPGGATVSLVLQWDTPAIKSPQLSIVAIRRLPRNIYKPDILDVL